MSENTQNQKVVVVANLKSPVIGFVLSLFLGWLGVDRFYKGGVVSIVAGIIKLIIGLIFFFGFAFIFIFAIGIGGTIGYIAQFLFFGYIIWYILDLIFVPLGIVSDNRKKLAIMQGSNQAQEKITAKSIGKSVLNIIISVVVAIGVLVLAVIIFLFVWLKG